MAETDVQNSRRSFTCAYLLHTRLLVCPGAVLGCKDKSCKIEIDSPDPKLGWTFLKGPQPTSTIVWCMHLSSSGILYKHAGG